MMMKRARDEGDALPVGDCPSVIRFAPAMAMGNRPSLEMGGEHFTRCTT
jgi:hypothetical protein